ncbi:MAG: hypothetical protein IPN95_31045 [Bacteroidetes bacterium]|nr:hypothetical protein [Bacteroidota bacterium]
MPLLGAGGVKGLAAATGCVVALAIGGALGVALATVSALADVFATGGATGFLPLFLLPSAGVFVFAIVFCINTMLSQYSLLNH